MINYFKLVNFEFNRLFKLYVSLALLMVIVQLTGTYLIAKNYMKTVTNEMSITGGISLAEYIEENGQFSFHNIANSSSFSFPVLIFMAFLFLYIFYIWYRDWFGKNTFIYRLLMLPTARINLFFAKATTILLGMLGVMALQLILLFFHQRIIEMIVPIELRTNLNMQTMLSTFDYERILYPFTGLDLLMNIAFLITAVLVLFTIILLERSFRLKGIVIGIIYGVLAFCIFFAQVLALIILEKNYFYPLENLLIQIALVVLVIGTSIYLSHYLLRKKITV